MKLNPDSFYHVYNRGNNRQQIFFDKGNYDFFLSKVKYKLLTCCELVCYCLMPNHFHLLFYFPENFNENIFLNNFKTCLSSYTRAINKQNNSTGSLFQQHTKMKCLSNNKNNYSLICFNYIHQNPLKADLVKKLEDWEFSSFRDYIGVSSNSICNIKLAKDYLEIPQNKKEFFKWSYEIINEDELKEVL